MNGITRPTLAQTLEALAHYAGQTKQDARTTLTGLLGILVQAPEGHSTTLQIFNIFIEQAQRPEPPAPTAQVVTHKAMAALRAKRVKGVNHG